MSVKWVSVFALFLATAMVGCGSAESLGTYTIASAANASLNQQTPLTDEVSREETKTARRVIREGELRFETTDKAATRQTILQLVSMHQGYLSDDREQRNQDVLEQTMTIRVPSAEFDGLLEDVSIGIPHFDKREVRAIDVTDEFVDVEARVQTKKETESRYRELLTQAN